jgi:hypothetical protein
VIPDLTLGEESGLPIAEALAARSVPLVYASNHFEEEFANFPKLAAFLAKPFTFADFEAVVRPLLTEASAS